MHLVVRGGVVRRVVVHHGFVRGILRGVVRGIARRVVRRVVYVLVRVRAEMGVRRGACVLALAQVRLLGGACAEVLPRAQGVCARRGACVSEVRAPACRGGVVGSARACVV